jgi:hypothetical protein
MNSEDLHYSDSGKTTVIPAQAGIRDLAKNFDSVPTVSGDVFKPLKMLDLSVFCFRRKQRKSTCSRSFSVHF